eukprot:scaffold56574_cov57-Phaeocystis_antarctica.AAC.1
MHQGGAAEQVLQVKAGRVLQEEEQGGEVAVDRSIHERGVAEAAWQVDARASLQQLPHHLHVVVSCGSVQQGEAQTASASPSLHSHLTTIWSSPRCADLRISRGSGAGELTPGSPASSGAAGGAAAGCGGASCCRMSSAMALGVGLGSQQGLRARLVPLVNAGQVLQEDEHDGEAAMTRSSHERGEAVAVRQVDARASLQQLQVAVGCGGTATMQHGCGRGLTWCRAERIDRSFLAYQWVGEPRTDRLGRTRAPGAGYGLAGRAAVGLSRVISGGQGGLWAM